MRTRLQRVVGRVAQHRLVHRWWVPKAFRGSNSDYQRFVIIGHARSGSSMLIAALGKHPQVLTFGEVLNYVNIRFHRPGYNHDSRLLKALRRHYPQKFIDRFVFGSYPEGLQAVGFKVFYRQLDLPEFRSVWDWLDRERNVKVILLHREHILATYFSHLVAQNTGVWSVQSESQRPNVQLTMDYDACLKEFVAQQQYREQAIERTRQHPVLSLTYEQLNTEWDQHMNRVQEFLGVDVQPLPNPKIKVNTRPLSESIENYQELRERFRGTPWFGQFQAT